MNRDLQSFSQQGARVRRAMAVEQRRTAQAIGDSIRRRGAGRDRYDAATHAFVMLDVDRELDRIYGDSRGSGAGALLRLIVRHARAAWQDRIDRVALVGGGIADEPNVGRNPPE